MSGRSARTAGELVRNGQQLLSACRIVGGRRFAHVRPVSSAVTGDLAPRTGICSEAAPSSILGPSRLSPAKKGLSLRSYAASAAAVNLDTSPAPPTSNETQPSSLPPTPLESILIELTDVLENEIGFDEGDVWMQRLEDAKGRLESSRAGGSGSRGGLKGCSVAVYGPLSSLPNQLITSLLTEPLAEDERTREGIARRHAGLGGSEVGERSGVFVNRFASTLQLGESSLVCDSPWLREAGYELREIISESPNQVLSDLFASDIPILIIDPIQLLDAPETREILPELIGKPGLRIVVNGRIGGGETVGEEDVLQIQERLRLKIMQQLASISPGTAQPDLTPPSIPISFVDSTSALLAMSSLRASLTLSSSAREQAFHSFQSLYMASNLGSLSQSLLGDLRATHEDARMGRLERRSVGYVVDRVVRRGLNVVGGLRADGHEVIRKLEGLLQDTRTIVQTSASKSFTQHAAISAELEKAKSAVRKVLDERLTWWKVVGWRVDSVAEELGQEVQGRWGHGLAQQLSFEAGKLQAAQNQISTEISDLLQSLKAASQQPSNAFYSPILANQLEQIDSTTPIHSSSLLSPVDRRRAQLLQFSVPALHKRGHQTTWTMYPLIFLTSSLSWSAAVPLELVSGATGTGVALLSGLAVVRWAAGRWKRAEKLFWRDWERVSEGLEEDLQAELNDLVKGRVLAKAVYADRGLRSLVQARSERMTKVEQKLDGLRAAASAMIEKT